MREKLATRSSSVGVQCEFVRGDGTEGAFLAQNECLSCQLATGIEVWLNLTTTLRACALSTYSVWIDEL